MTTGEDTGQEVQLQIVKVMSREIKASNYVFKTAPKRSVRESHNKSPRVVQSTQWKCAAPSPPNAKLAGLWPRTSMRSATPFNTSATWLNAAFIAIMQRVYIPCGLEPLLSMHFQFHLYNRLSGTGDGRIHSKITKQVERGGRQFNCKH